MMMHEPLPVRDRPRRLGDDVERGEGPARAAVAGRLRAAAHLLPDDPDAAALLLDGLLQEIARLWCAAAGLPVPAPALRPALVERHDQPFGWRLRLALRAPDVRARLVHCAALYGLLGGECPPARDERRA